MSSLVYCSRGIGRFVWIPDQKGVNINNGATSKLMPRDVKDL
jgi:hypothetical protein